MTAVLAILLMAAVAGGIAWPMLRPRFARSAAVAADPAAVTATTAPITAQGHVEQLCPACSRVNPASRKLCLDCNEPLPVADARQLLEGVNKEDAIREGIQGGVLMLGMIIAMALANFLPMAGKLAILMATIAILGYRFLRNLQG